MTPFQQSAAGDVTGLLRLWSAGDELAFEQLIPLVYDELHRMALRYLTGERSTVSLQATALVNEVCLRLLGWDEVRWQNRGHFFGVSAQMMRRVLVDIARRRRADRRGGPRGACAARRHRRGCCRTGRRAGGDRRSARKAGAEDPRKARVVELRFFGGLSIEETAQTLGISLRTANNDWAFARAWLYRALTEGRKT